MVPLVASPLVVDPEAGTATATRSTVPLTSPDMELHLPLGAGIAAAFQVFAAAGERGAPAPWRDAWHGVHRYGMRATTVWALLCALLLVVMMDVFAIWATPWAAVIGPVLGMLVLLGVPTALIALAGLSRNPDLTLPALVPASAWLAVRRAPLLTLVVLGAWVMTVLAQPVAGVLGVGDSPST